MNDRFVNDRAIIGFPACSPITVIVMFEELITINELFKADKPELRFFFKLFSMMRGTADSGFGRVLEVYDLKGEKLRIRRKSELMQR